MLDIKLIRENPDIIRKDLEKRKETEKLEWLDELLKVDKEWRDIKFDLQKLQKQRNDVTREIAMLKKEGKNVDDKLKAMREIGQGITHEEAQQEKRMEKINFYLMRLPNVMHESVPYGKDDTENVEIKQWGKLPEFNFELKSHGEIAENLEIGDFKRGVKVAGSGFYFLKGDLALLNQALIRFALEKLVKKNYIFVEPPIMINKNVCDGVTDYEFFKDMIYKIEDEDLHLIATSEHPLMGMYMGETIDDSQLPLRYVGLSPCFRKEIGSHGVDEKGLFRVHQFHKVEQVILCKSEDSWRLHEELLANAEEIFQELELPYRVVNICTGDLGIVAAKKYDLEVWMPRQKQYREAVSCSNCTDYQCRRLGIKCGKEGGDKQVAHSLNSTAIATSRVLVAILENNQNVDGSVRVPKVLVPYMFGKEVIGAKK